MEQCLKGKKNSGFVALLVVVIFSVVGTIMAIALLSSNGLFFETINSLENSEKAKALAGACSEEALLYAKSNLASSSEKMKLMGGECSYEIVFSGEEITIKSIGIVNSYIAKEIINVKKNNNNLELIYYNDDF